jgi:hypothetical protein
MQTNPGEGPYLPRRIGHTADQSNRSTKLVPRDLLMSFPHAGQTSSSLGCCVTHQIIWRGGYCFKRQVFRVVDCGHNLRSAPLDIPITTSQRLLLRSEMRSPL